MYLIWCDWCIIDDIYDLAEEHGNEKVMNIMATMLLLLPIENGEHGGPPREIIDCPHHLIERGRKLVRKYLNEEAAQDVFDLMLEIDE